MAKQPTLLTMTSLILLMDTSLLSQKDQDRLYIMIGYKVLRKSIVKYLIEINSIYITIFEKISNYSKISSQNSQNLNPSMIFSYLTYEEQSLFTSFINLTKGIPEGLVFLGLNLYTLNLDNNKNLDIELIDMMIYFYNSDITDVFILTLNRISLKKIKIVSSLIGESIDYNQNDGILERHPLILFNIDSLVCISRVLYQRYELEQVDKYICNVIDNLINSSILSYNIKDTTNNGSSCLLIKPHKQREKTILDMIQENDFDYQNKQIDIKLYYKLDQSELENPISKFEDYNTKHLIKINTTVTFSLFLPIDTLLSNLEEKIKLKVSNILKTKIIPNIQNNKTKQHQSTSLSINSKTRLINNDGLSIEFDSYITTFKNEYDKVFAKEIKRNNDLFKLSN